METIQLFKAWANYNRNVNRIVGGHLLELADEAFLRRIDAHYPTVYETFLHVMESDSRWLGRLKGAPAVAFDAEGFAAFRKEALEDPSGLCARRDTLIEWRSRLDEAIAALIDTLTDADVAATRTIPFGPSALTIELWKLLFQWFNHHAHHRGQISLFLDLAGVKNDFSLMLDKLEKR